ncbi:hypothetical protein SAMN05444817_1057 [Corynebacterium appendicis CIP 107643]|uniref:Uncharacterized protein n=1 Tax=Corynebacterium appendicis CIP 107643 TaxID=1161099 RepID=A0A1N7J9R5_9CORY|nr:hypothetical protein [Corynebacterium appendicis]WJY60245.1 hypothetical protein CAPP_01510 [Corynebacterium appendicis CIP 107643]SIS46001.1 hypothetical protein SAMN05444817_1057 [Corynebacterium appendicis CIP 107643]
MAAFSVTQDAAEAIRDVALSVDGVAGVSGGRMGQAFLRVSGAMIEGIQLIDDTVPHLALHLTYDLSSRRQIPAIVTDVRSAVLALPAFAELALGSNADSDSGAGSDSGSSAGSEPRIDVVFDDAA